NLRLGNHTVDSSQFTAQLPDECPPAFRMLSHLPDQISGRSRACHPGHDPERDADDGWIFAAPKGAWHRHARLMRHLQDAELLGARQADGHFGWRVTAHNQFVPPFPLATTTFDRHAEIVLNGSA